MTNLEALMKKIILSIACLIVASSPHLFAKEDTEPQPSQAASSSAPKNFVSGIKQVAYEGPKDLAKETLEEVPKKPSIVGVVEGVNRGTQKLIDHTIKGAYKVATLGKSELDHYEVQEPEKGSDEPTKFKISLPGT